VFFIDDERTPGLLWISFGAIATALALPLFQTASPAIAVAGVAPGVAMVGFGIWSIARLSR